MNVMHPLKNGQIAMLFETVETCVLYPGRRLRYIDFVIGDTKQECKRWYKELNSESGEKLDTATTGKGDLEGMLFALSVIRGLQEQLEDEDILIIQPTDDRRDRVYRRLLKYGFKKEANHYSYSR